MKRKKVYLVCGLLAIVSCLYLPSLSHEVDMEFKVKHKEVVVDEVAIKTLGIETSSVKEGIVDDVVKTTGEIQGIPNNYFDVNCPVQGKVKSILVELGDKVKAGQPLAIVQSTEISKLQAEADQFKAECELTKKNYDRLNTLVERGISARKDLEAAKAALLNAQAKLNASESNLRIFTSLTTDSEQGTFTIVSKKSGTIVERSITLGQVLAPNQTVFRGIDLLNVWASADIYEKDISKVALGQKVQVALDGSPDKIFEGKITYIGSIVNKDTRTLPVKATLHNIVKPLYAEILQPGSFVQISIHTKQKKKSIVIPKTALVEIDKENIEGRHKHIVYVKKTSESQIFIPRKIEVEVHDSNTVEVVSGLMAGDILVTQGAYQLQYGGGKSESEHEHEKSVEGFHITPLIMLLGMLLASLIGFILGRKKKTK